MIRREFMKKAAGFAAASAVSARLAQAASLDAASPAADALWRPHSIKHISLELYSVRNEMKKDPEGTLAAIRAMGYDEVELLWSFGNFGRTNFQVKAALKNTGLKAPTAHIAPELLTRDWSSSLEAARYLGQQYLIVPSLPEETNTSLDAWKKWADIFNVAGAEARKAKVWLAFHNEPNHQKPIDGVIPYDLFIERTDPAIVRLQLDIGNMRMGGGDPLAYVKAHQDRYCSFHIKDVVADGSHDTELGTGSLDITAFLRATRNPDRKPMVIEQEGSAAPLESAKRNYEYLRRLRF